MRPKAARGRPSDLPRIEVGEADELTGALRRAGAANAIARELKRARRLQAVLTVAFIRLDANEAGTPGLKALADTLSGRLRAADVVGRWAADELVCALPDCDGPRAAALLSGVRAAFLGWSGLSFRAGLATSRADDDLEDLLRRAGADLHRQQAELAGRARLRIARAGVAASRPAPSEAAAKEG